MARRRIGVALLALAASLASAAALGGTAAAARATMGTSVPPCTTSKVVVWLDTRAGAAAGSRYYHLELTNLSRRACTLLGYPGVSAIDLEGRRLGSAASRNAVHVARRVVLTPGSNATALLQIATAGNFPTSLCRPVTAAGLRVRLPNRTEAKTVPFPFPACSRAGPIYLSVGPLSKA